MPNWDRTCRNCRLIGSYLDFSPSVRRNVIVEPEDQECHRSPGCGKTVAWRGADDHVNDDEADGIEFDSRERSAVLAGLRLIQHFTAQTKIDSAGIIEILTNGGTVEPLTAAEIDALCERLT